MQFIILLYWLSCLLHASNNMLHCPKVVRRHAFRFFGTSLDEPMHILHALLSLPSLTLGKHFLNKERGLIPGPWVSTSKGRLKNSKNPGGSTSGLRHQAALQAVQKVLGWKSQLAKCQAWNEPFESRCQAEALMILLCGHESKPIQAFFLVHILNTALRCFEYLSLSNFQNGTSVLNRATGFWPKNRWHFAGSSQWQAKGHPNFFSAFAPGGLVESRQNRCPSTTRSVAWQLWHLYSHNIKKSWDHHEPCKYWFRALISWTNQAKWPESLQRFELDHRNC